MFFNTMFGISSTPEDNLAFSFENMYSSLSFVTKYCSACNAFKSLDFFHH